MLRFQSTTAPLTEGGLPVMESAFYPVKGNRSQAGGDKKMTCVFMQSYNPTYPG